VIFGLVLGLLEELFAFVLGGSGWFYFEELVLEDLGNWLCGFEGLVGFELVPVAREIGGDVGLPAVGLVGGEGEVVNDSCFRDLYFVGDGAVAAFFDDSGEELGVVRYFGAGG
jgi:hypothetical protein